MKKLSLEVNKVREENKSFFVLEKFDYDTREGVLETAKFVEEQAKKLNVPVSELLEALLTISK